MKVRFPELVYFLRLYHDLCLYFQLLIVAILSLCRMEVLLAIRQSIQIVSPTDVMKDSFCMAPQGLLVRQMEHGAKLQAIAKVNFIN